MYIPFLLSHCSSGGKVDANVADEMPSVTDGVGLLWYLKKQKKKKNFLRPAREEVSLWNHLLMI